MRNTIISLYQPAHLASLIPTMQSFIESATKNLHEKSENITFNALSLKLATDVIGSAAFGVDFGLSKDGVENGKDDDVTRFIDQHMYSTTSLKMDLSGSVSIIIGLLLPILQEPLRQILKLIPGTADRKIDQTNKSLSSQLDEIVAKRMEDKGRGVSKDFLSAILNARETDGVSKDIFSSDYISALAYEHLVAGSATTSFTLTSILYLVSAHEEVEKKLLEEIDAFKPIDAVPTAEDLNQKFPYIDQVV